MLFHQTTLSTLHLTSSYQHMAYIRQAAAAETVSRGETPNCKGHCGHCSGTLSSHHQEGLPLHTLSTQESTLSKNTLFPPCLTLSCTNPSLPYSQTSSKDNYMTSRYFLMTRSMVSPGIFSFPTQVFLLLIVTPPIRKGPRPTLYNRSQFPFLPQGSTRLLLILASNDTP